MQNAALLEISRVQDAYRFRLEQPGLGAAVQEHVTPPIAAADQRALREAIEQAASNPAGACSLEDLGRLLHNLLLPREIQAFLRELDRPLVISTDAPEIPWELFYSDEPGQFLGLRLPVGRRLVTVAEVRPLAAALPEPPASFLLIGNPQGDLPGADREADLLQNLLGRMGAPVRVLSGSRAALLPVQLALQSEDYLVIHYAGHAEQDRASKESALLLAERGRLSAEMIRKLVRGRPFVFLNACGSDRPSEPGRRAALPWPVCEGLAAAFVAAGARAVIGTRWEVGDQASAEMAALFYERALQGAPIGEALRQARVRFRQQRPGDATWAAFVLYGDPCLSLVNPAGAFLPDGRLNRSRFSSRANTALDLALVEAQQLGYGFVGTPHLFIALTKIEGGRTQEVLQRLDCQPQAVRDRLRSEMRRGQPTGTPPTLEAGSFSRRAARILQAAGEEAAAAGAAVIDEEHLLAALAHELDGPTAQSLQRQGVDLRRISALLRGEHTGEHLYAAAPAVPKRERGLHSWMSQLDRDARQALMFAQEEAQRGGHERVETPHLVIGLAMVEGGFTARSLERLGLDPRRVCSVLRSALRPGSASPGEVEQGGVRLAPHVQQILQMATAEAERRGAAAGERDLWAAFQRLQGSATAELLRRLGIRVDLMLASSEGGGANAGASATPLLDRLGRDLTCEAREGRLKPVVGRRRELARIAQVLARSDKNAPLLVGDAGVGKTAVVEALAQRIADGAVPAHLRGARLIELPVANLVAGTRYRGDLEERLAQVIQEASRPDIILFLDEVHTIVGAGQAEGGTLDAATILKPALARGQIRCIGATTPGDYRRTIEKDPALSRRFQRVWVGEPTPEETLEILRQTAHRYEEHHRVRLTDEALQAAVRLAEAYLVERRFPDKAGDLIEEACVRARVQSPSRWPEPEGTDLPRIDPAMVAEVVAEWTGIPVARLTEAEHSRLLDLERLLHERVVGQDEAVSALVQAVRLARVGLRQENRPVGVFLFVGPTGVGKTQVAKALAEILLGSEQALIRFDMSEFAEPHSVARLIGSPPGYKGHEEGGHLTEALRRRPYAVVLLDEIDRAHPDVVDLLLQLFDDGRLTDGQGRVADGRHAIFIMTTNAGAGPAAGRRLGLLAPAEAEPAEPPAGLGLPFRPEFLNRIDRVVQFRHLTPEQVRTIARMQLQALAARVEALHGIRLEVEEGAIDLICREGYSREYGARPLQRTIERLVAQPLGDLVLAGTRGAVVVAGVDGQMRVLPGSGSASAGDAPGDEPAKEA